MVSADIVNGARRVLIYGVTGSGKSTLAARLSGIIGVTWHSVDDLTWQPGWIEVPTDQQRILIHAICEESEWILDTAYGKWLDVPLRRAELIVALDYPRWFSLQRLVRRTLARLIDRQLICNGNRETLRQIVSPDSIIVWHFKSFGRKRERIRRWMTDPSAPPVHRLTSERQTKRWLANAAGKLGEH
jgi:adenylate kinase family enzyme